MHPRDARRESELAPNDFALEVPVPGDGIVELVTSPAELFAGMARLARPRSVTVLVATPDSTLRAVDGREVHSPELYVALASDRTTVRLAPAAASALGLSERTAMAGLARINAGPLGNWGVAVVASAERERDRERRARLRLILAVALAAGLVLGVRRLGLAPAAQGALARARARGGRDRPRARRAARAA